MLGETRSKVGSVERRTIDQWRMATAKARAATKVEKGDETIRKLEHQVLKLEDELRDAAAIEVALYSVVAEHASSAHKVHTPARRLARFYIHAYKNWSPERRPSIARNIVSGLVLVVRACGNDVPRLTYWWSNVVVLRETISQSCEDVELSTSSTETEGDVPISNANGSDFAARALRSQHLRKTRLAQDTNQMLSPPPGAGKDWRTCSTFLSSLMRVEAWIHGRVLESVWWQAITPWMQLAAPASTRGSSADVHGDLNKFAGDSRELFSKTKVDSNPCKLGDTRQGNISVEIWKRAFADALKRLCPPQGEGLDCGCLPVLKKMVIQECVTRLDVAMFNGILRDPDDDAPTDPLADPITDLSVLPIPIGGLTFGAGSHLNNVVVNWSTWLSALVSIKDRIPVESRNGEGITAKPKEIEDEEPVQFNLLKATGDLLMLPKDILLDSEIRREVCPALSLPLIRRVLANFVPDIFSPEPISPTLLAELNSEVSLERKNQGEADISSDDIAMACVPPIFYSPPSTNFVRVWIGEPSGAATWGRSSSSALRKGYTSDEELEEYQNPLALLEDKPHYDSTSAGKKKKKDEVVGGSRFQLLREAWISS
ncbi:unnamed protein product [Sphagnum jensenii]|uniref:Dilute domain-containing protein n=1 Tax=Sphagnum jensenii TaxID=128206 RepID=A0ABP0X5N8_9BRYO